MNNQCINFMQFVRIWILQLLFNPFFPKISLVILCLPCSFYDFSSENFLLDQLIITYLIFFIMLFNSLIDNVLILWGKILSWSLVGFEGSRYFSIILKLINPASWNTVVGDTVSQWFVPWYLGQEVWFQNLARSLCSGIYKTLNSVITQLHKVE